MTVRVDGSLVSSRLEVGELQVLVYHEEFEGEMAEMFGAARIETRIEQHDEGDGKTRLVLSFFPAGSCGPRLRGERLGPHDPLTGDWWRGA